MGPTTTVPRLSPKVRRLLREHDVEPRSVPGTGIHGRVTPADVLAAAGVPRSGARSAVAASPAARRLLREAGVDLRVASDAADGSRLTRRVAEQVIADGDTSTDRGAARQQPAAPPAPRGTGHDRSTVAAEVDVAVLLAHLHAADAATTARNGFRVSPVLAIASVLADTLAKHAASWTSTDHGRAPEVALGLGWPDRDEPVVVPDAAVLTVAGLARRAHAAAADGGDEDVVPAVVVAPHGTATPAVLGATASVGVLTVDAPVPRQVEDTDELGLPVTRTRPHMTIRLHHDDALAATDATALLDALAAALVAFDRPVGS